MAADTTLKLQVLGAGAWGTALAIHLARAGHQVTLWSHSLTHAEQMQLSRENSRYLPGFAFPDNLNVSAEMTLAEKPDGILVVVPSDAFKQVLLQLKQCDEALPNHIAWATKGFEPQSRKLLHEVAIEVLGEEAPIAVLSGPTFAQEVAKGLPTAIVSAALTEVEAQFWADAFHHDYFRVYTQLDMAGVEVGGAYKNIMAIATGVSDGLKLGANARAALISRGMAEMIRFGEALGGKAETLMGLTGLGDLVLTCTDDLSRNRRFGLQLAQSGLSAEQIQQKIGQVVEGVKAVRIVKQIAEEKQLDLPIMEQVFALVSGEKSPKEAVIALLARENKPEAIG
jgi:glycerol-3-phosphate dehydrogenase (NAD(P)+)